MWKTGLYYELLDKIFKESYIEYTLLYVTITNRIDIDEAMDKDGHLKLMDNIYGVK